MRAVSRHGSANKLLSKALERDREWLDERRDIAESFYKLSANDNHAETFLSLVERSERIMDKFKSGRSQTGADTFSVTSVCMSSPRIWEPAPAASGEEFVLEESDPKPTEERSDQAECSCQDFADEQGDGQILEHAVRLEERQRKMEERKRRSWKNLVISDENSDSLFLTINLHDALDRRADFPLEEPIPPGPGLTKKVGPIQSTVPPDAKPPQQQDHTAIPLIVPRLRGDWEELSEGEEGCEEEGGSVMETENRKSLPDLDVPTEGSVPPPSLVHEGKKCKQREMLAAAQTEQQRDEENLTQLAGSGDDAAATTTSKPNKIGAEAERKEERRRKLEQRKRRSWKHLLMEDENRDSLFLEINLHDALDTHTDSKTEAQLESHRN